MKFYSIYDKATYKIRHLVNLFILNHRRFYWRLLRAQIQPKVYFSKIYITWPHQVKIHSNSVIEPNVFFKYDGIWQPGPSIVIGRNCFIGMNCEFNIKDGITIGDNSLIGSGSRFIDHDHGIGLDKLINNQPCPTTSITIENDVWIGANVVVLKGVTIGKGAVIAAGTIVNKSIPSYEIWGGVPAKKISVRK